MLPSGVLVSFVAKHIERADEARPRRPGIDDVVDVSPRGGNVGMSEFGPIFLDAGLCGGLWIFSRIEFFSEQYFNGPLWTHDRDFGCRPRQVHVPSDVLGVHHVIGPTVGLTDNDRDFRDRGLGEGVQKFRAVPDDPTMLLDRKSVV